MGLVESRWEKERRLKRDGGDFVADENKDSDVGEKPKEETPEEGEKEQVEDKEKEEE